MPLEPEIAEEAAERLARAREALANGEVEPVWRCNGCGAVVPRPLGPGPHRHRCSAYAEGWIVPDEELEQQWKQDGGPCDAAGV